MQKKYDIIEFLNKKYPIYNMDIKISDIEDVLIFAVFWNHIENGDNKTQYNIIKDFIDSKVFDEEGNIKEIIDYFISRYKTDINKFELLKKTDSKLREINLHEICKGYISKNGLTLENKKELIAYIIYRFRNRLFHGEKQFIKQQNDNFIIINNFLYSLLS